MSEPDRYGNAAARLSEERARLEGARADYDVIAQSRFHALRMLWFSLKQALGFSTDDAVFAVWSKGITPALAGQRGGGRASAAALDETEKALVDAWNRRVASRAPGAQPVATVVIPVFNHSDVTARCLRSIADSWFESLDVQFVVVDDGSTDGTAQLVTQMHGIDYLRCGRNEGFVRACNRGAALARGRYVCFLNNDTVVRDGWLDHLVNTAERDATIGVVGAKLVYPDGRLQEAGGIVWRDGTGWNVGRNESAADPRYNFVRDADYVSGAALLVRKDLFDRVGGFDERFVPAYYEDTDLCFAVRELGFRVVYQPLSVVVHDEGVTSGDERAGVKRFQEINRPKFREKWAAQLEAHFENGAQNVPAAMRSGRGSKILLVDSYVPLYDRESGSQRMLHVVKMLREAGHHLTFLPDNYAPIEPYTSELQQMGVEVLHHVDGGRTLHEALDAVVPSLDVAWISRHDLYEKYEPLVRRNRNLRVIYDTVDLAHVRRRRRAAVLGETDDEWRELQRVEIAAARSADATVVVTADERAALADLGLHDVCVIPNVHQFTVSGERRYEDSSGLLFIGNYNHPPNVDAVQWLCNSVMPIVWKSLPGVSLTLAGSSNPPQSVFALRSDRVRVTGYVHDVSAYFRESRVFVAPLRFGAGMKGKIGQALEYALPVVTTPVGAEGLGLRDGGNAAIVEANPEAFAAAVVALYGDAERWRSISNAAAATLLPFTPDAVRPELAALLQRLAALQLA